MEFFSSFVLLYVFSFLDNNYLVWNRIFKGPLFGAKIMLENNVFWTIGKQVQHPLVEEKTEPPVSSWVYAEHCLGRFVGFSLQFLVTCEIPMDDIAAVQVFQSRG